MWLVLFLISTVSLLFYIFLTKKKKDFWEPYGVRQVHHSTLKNNLDAFLGKMTFAEMDRVVYNSMENDEKFCGIVQLQEPFLLVKDLELVKKILIKDFEYFVDRRDIVPEKTQPMLAKMVANLHGEEWKGVRVSLTPTFSTGKIRRMMEYFNSVGNEWTNHFKEEVQKSGGNEIKINVLTETTRYAVDVIANAVFGIDAGAIRKPDSLFAKNAHKLAKFDTWQIIKFGLAMNFPKLCELFGIKLLHQETLHFFESILTRGMKQRLEGSVKRNDFLQLVAEARKGVLTDQASDELSSFEKDAILTGDFIEKKNWLNDDETAMAQVIGFFFAGYFPTSNLIGFMMYCLALHPECQEKLREEVNQQVFVNGKQDIDYDVLNGLNYLEMFTCEVLRRYAPADRLERKCVKDYVDKENNFQVPKGAHVAIPVLAIHLDKKYYDYPEEFYPEHFTPENKAKRHPYSFLPFGTGPRNCIGRRFALVKSKAAIVHLVHKYYIEPTKKTPIPLKIKPFGMGVAIPDELELKLRPISM